MRFCFPVRFRFLARLLVVLSSVLAVVSLGVENAKQTGTLNFSVMILGLDPKSAPFRRPARHRKDYSQAFLLHWRNCPSAPWRFQICRLCHWLFLFGSPLAASYITCTLILTIHYWHTLGSVHFSVQMILMGSTFHIYYIQRHRLRASYMFLSSTEKTPAA